jgi:thymidylate synthase ThyX
MRSRRPSPSTTSNHPYTSKSRTATATDNGRGPLPWDNFFTQRDRPDAQPEFHHVASLLLEAYLASVPRVVPEGTWHTPFILPDEEDLPEIARIQLSVARCARVSYETFDGVRSIEKDVELYFKLLGADPPHMSPFEHVAYAANTPTVRSGNFRGWVQHRGIVFGQEQTRHARLEAQREALGIGPGRTVVLPS